MSHYDVRLNWDVGNTCNLTCVYCPRNRGTAIDPEKNEPIARIINIPLLLRTIDKTNKIFLINFSGNNESFLVKNIIEALAEVSKKHYVSCTTNLISNKVQEFYEKIDPSRVHHIMASLHIKELERTNLLDRFVINFLEFKKRGFNIQALEVAYPPLLGEVEKYRKMLKERGVEFRFKPFKGEFAGRVYPHDYSKEEIGIFDLENNGADSIRNFHQRGVMCNAGYNSAVVTSDGYIFPCFRFHKVSLGNIYKEIKFRKSLIKCPADYCPCPDNRYDEYLWKKALKEKKVTAE